MQYTAMNPERRGISPALFFRRRGLNHLILTLTKACDTRKMRMVEFQRVGKQKDVQETESRAVYC
jgi:hypothetical protein